MIKNLINTLTVIQHDKTENPDMVILDQGFKMLLELYIYNGLNLKKILDNKLTIDHLIMIYNDVIDQYEKYRLNPGEYVGL